jgi:hypothetical protein
MSDQLKVLWAYGKRGFVAERDGKIVFISHRKWSKHLFRKYHAWGVSVDIIQDISDRSVELICIYDTENETEYTVSLQNFLSGGRTGKFFPHDTQIFLRLDKWTKTHKRQKLVEEFSDADAHDMVG